MEGKDRHVRLSSDFHTCAVTSAHPQSHNDYEHTHTQHTHAHIMHALHTRRLSW